MLFDSHAHLDDEAFDEDRDLIISELEENNIKYVLNPGCDRKTSEIAYDLANKYDNIYGAVGNHPHDADKLSQDDLKRYEEMTDNEKILAIGEIGLDFYYDNSPRDIQVEVFRIQMDLAERLDLPVLIHMRDATKETLEILRSFNGRVSGVLHCYSEDWENAKKFLDLGYYIALGGMVTFKKAEATREVARKIPLDLLLLETDAPYLAPEPKRGRRNEPKGVNYVAQRIAEERNEELETIEEVTFNNTMEMLGL